MKLPRIVVYTVVLAFLVLLYLTMQELRFYFIPASLGGLLAMLMLPLNRKLESIRFPRVLAIAVSLLIMLVVFAGLNFLLFTQLVRFTDDLPELQKQIAEKFSQLQTFIADKAGIAYDKQMKFMNTEADAILQSIGKWATGLLLSTGTMLITLALIVVHFFLFLLYRERIKGFLLIMLPKHDHETAGDVIEKIAGVTRQYLTGVLIVMSILSVLNSVGLLALGIKNAIFFGILAAVLNIIPYVGSWIGTLLPMTMALITKDSLFYPLAVIGLFVVTQFIDNNFLTPRITGSQVRINALAAFGAIIIGNIVWGVAGMILFIPFLGMMKIVFDNVEELKPFGYLIGDNHSEKELRIAQKVKKNQSRKKAATAES